MSQYTIKKIATSNNATSFSPDWQAIDALTIDTYPWYQAGAKQDTQIKLSANNDTLFIQIIAQDNYSYAKQTELNHMLVCQDSCVEFFFSPSGVLGSSYVNLEVNCCGTLHLAYGTGRDKRQFISLEAASLIQRNTSITSPVKFETDHDNEWTVDIALPFTAIEQLTGEKVNKDKWFGNFYRCGGRTEPQYAVWHNIDVPEPDYHRPEHFGKLVFI
ncbi:carbohydrate-binding family 9-like protein [Colwellia sp. TT2012]|uniref:carbohydrate-binding family 9-like protein n=1 Tax=Colwellia sp. TT2012 TaxID=1720342 RepID=UPI00070FF371|nr:carbohydrate-binding family 9-like protein [Colwellia sp. TT2012]